MEGLAGKVAIVTGAGRGIGRAIALKLAGNGVKVAINDLPGSPGAPEVAREIAKKGGVSMLALADVTFSPEVTRAVESVVEHWKKIDILVNNAGIVGQGKPVAATTDEEWDAVLDTNLRGAFVFSRAVIPHMVQQNGGRIINTASVAGIAGRASRADYCSSKGGLITFTRSLAYEVGKNNITVNAIAPGFIVTDMTRDLVERARPKIVERTALKRLGSPDDIAEMAVFLASDRAGFITAQVICVDGGEI